MSINQKGIGSEENPESHYHFNSNDKGRLQILDQLFFHNVNMASGWIGINDGTGAQLNRGFFREITTGIVTDNDCIIYISPTYAFPALFQLNQITQWKITFHLSQIANQNIWFKLVTALTDPPIDTDIHVGWKIINNSVYCTNGNGTNGNATLISNTPGTAKRTVAIEFNSAYINYWWENNLVNKVNTYIPIANQNLVYHFQIRTKENVAKTMKIYNSIIMRKPQ